MDQPLAHQAQREACDARRRSGPTSEPAVIEVSDAASHQRRAAAGVALERGAALGVGEHDAVALRAAARARSLKPGRDGRERAARAAASGRRRARAARAPPASSLGDARDRDLGAREDLAARPARRPGARSARRPARRSCSASFGVARSSRAGSPRACAMPAARRRAPARASPRSSRARRRCPGSTWQCRSITGRRTLRQRRRAIRARARI